VPNATIGTTAQVATATAVPAGTIRRWAHNGWITPVNDSRPHRYDARQVLAVRRRCKEADTPSTGQVAP
jgi:DNA-binding transcriptional MerR regulator